MGVVGTGPEASVETGQTQQNVPEKKEKPSITQLPPSPKVSDQDLNQGHSNENLERFFSGSLRGMNPTGWVTEMAKRYGLTAGGAMDLTTGWDFDLQEHGDRAMRGFEV